MEQIKNGWRKFGNVRFYIPSFEGLTKNEALSKHTVTDKDGNQTRQSVINCRVISQCWGDIQASLKSLNLRTATKTPKAQSKPDKEEGDK